MLAISPSTLSTGRTTRILLVEDDESQRLTLSDILTAEGFDVETCENLNEAKLLLQTESFVVVILDRRLPDGDGIELIEHIAANKIPTRVIMHTGYSSFESARDALNLGAFAYVEKASDPDELLRQLHRAAGDQLADQLKAEEELLGAILRTSIAAITIVDANGNITLANETAKSVLGMEADEITSRTYNDSAWKHTDFEGNPFPEHEMPFMRVRTTGKPVFDVQHAIEWPDGRRRYLSINGAPLFTKDGDFAGAVFCVTDISNSFLTEQVLRQSQSELESRVAQRTVELTEANQRLRAEIAEREQAETQLRQHQAELAHVGRLSTMGEMASGLAHELNQPLTAISNYARGILRRIESQNTSPADLLNAMVQIVQQTERANSIIQHLRQMVRKREPRRDSVQVNTLIEAVIQLLAYEARKEGVQLLTCLEESLPPIQADAIEVEQVVLNLIRNAIDASQGLAANRRTVHIKTFQLDDQVCIEIVDNGIGMSLVESEKVFEPFYTTKTEGMGMGLAISRAIIDSHCGKISAFPNETYGSTFRVQFPQKNDADNRSI